MLRKTLLFLVLFFGFAAAWAQQSVSVETEADTLMSRQNFVEAIKLYTKLIEASQLKDRPDYRPLYKRAVAYYSNSEFTNAIKDMDTFIPKFPDSHQARILRALAYRELGNVEKQLQDLEVAIELSGGDVQLLKWRGTLLMELNKYREAVYDFNVVKRIQDDPEVEMQLGYSYYNLQEPDSAFLAINKAIELEPSFVSPYIYGGSFALQENKYELAISYLKVALLIDQENATAWFYKGVAYMELEKKDQSCKCFQKAFYKGYDDAGDYLKQYCFEIED